MYTTQVDAARQHIITEEMRAVAAYEQMEEAEICRLIVAGQVVIPANRYHTCRESYGIGGMLKAKINVNLGTSRDCLGLDMEMEKVRRAVRMGAETVMDLNSFGDTQTFCRELVAECPAILGTVPIYDAPVYYHKALKDTTAQEQLNIFRMYAENDVDFMTTHCGINRQTTQCFRQQKRVTNIVSHGGSIMFAWTEITGSGNPFYECFDEVLRICREHDVTFSLGDACRPGCLEDAGDIARMEELVTLGELAQRAQAQDVQVIIEGPGYMPLHQIQANMELQRTICKGTPFYMLGPIVTDVASGYDHITAAIGGAMIAAYGASSLYYVIPAERLSPPDVDDVKEGIIASEITAHAANIAKEVKGAMDWNHQMAVTHGNLDWEHMLALAMDPDKARAYRAQSAPEREGTCTICRKICAIHDMNKLLRGEIVDIMEKG